MKPCKRCVLSSSQKTGPKWTGVEVISTVQIVLSRMEVTLNIYEKLNWSPSETKCWFPQNAVSVNVLVHSVSPEMTWSIWFLVTLFKVHLGWKVTRNMKLNPFAFRLYTHQKTEYHICSVLDIWLENWTMFFLMITK